MSDKYEALANRSMTLIRAAGFGFHADAEPGYVWRVGNDVAKLLDERAADVNFPDDPAALVLWGYPIERATDEMPGYLELVSR